MHEGLVQAVQYGGRVEVVEVSGFIAKCLATPPLPAARSSLAPPGTYTDGFARALARCIALQLPKNEHVRGLLWRMTRWSRGGMERW